MIGPLPAALHAEASRRGSALALQDRAGVQLSACELCVELAELCAALRALGIGPGDPVALVLPGGLQAALLTLSVLSCATAAPLNPDGKEWEYAQALQRSEPRLLVTAAGPHPAQAAARSLGIPIAELQIAPGRARSELRLRGASGVRAGAVRGSRLASEVALLLQTSGTSGRSKQVPLTQAQLLAAAGSVARSLQLGERDRALHCLPLFHIGGVADLLLAPLLSGGAALCAGSFCADAFLADLRSLRPTWTQLVPVMLEALAQRAAHEPGALARDGLRFVRSVSAPLGAQRMREFEAALGVPVIEIYGMTETAGLITGNPLPPGVRKPGSVGRPWGLEVALLCGGARVRDAGRLGEVLVRGASVMSGYRDAAPEEAAPFFEGWLRTGDLGSFDADGDLRLRGRVKEMINRGGEKIAPQEIDEVLLSHPAVQDAACFAAPHASLGETVAAWVVRVPGAALSQDQLQAYVRERLAFHKVPSAVHFGACVPRTGGGKLRRAALAAQFAAAVSAAPQPQTAAGAVSGEPLSPLGQRLAALWAQCIGCSEVGPRDDFSALGGDSLKAASFVNRLQQLLPGELLYVSSVFDAPTVVEYEGFLRLNYPALVARMLGESPPSPMAEAPGERVTRQRVAELRAWIGPPPAAALPAAPRNPSAIFVLSAPRSGSTLLRAMLAGHSALFAPPELYLLAYADLAQRRAAFAGSSSSQLEGLVRALMQLSGQSAAQCQRQLAELEASACPTPLCYRLLQEQLGARRLVDKTPAYGLHTETLARAERCFQTPLYIHLVRHPYGMIRSFEEARLEQLWIPRLAGGCGGAPAPFALRGRALAELIWLILNENIAEFLRGVPAERQCRIRFEALVARPETVLRELCQRLGLRFEPALLEPHADRAGRMTDGLHEVSRMIGDPKFHRFSRIEPAVGDSWKQAFDADFLGEPTLALAQQLGCGETIARVRDREELEL